MLTIDDIKYVSFRKSSIGGYRPEDVDVFIDDVQLSYKKLLDEKAELTKKLEILAEKVEQYRQDEECIRNTLMSAQKLSDASVREAKHKAEVIVKDASLKAEQIIGNANSKIAAKKIQLKELKDNVTEFKTKLLEIYKEHLKLIDALPEEKPDESFSSDVDDQTLELENPDVQSDTKNAQPEESNQKEIITKTVEKTNKLSESELKSDIEKELQASKEKYSKLKFGENYHIQNDDEESPIGLFNNTK